ncbi:gp53-like domain-containing protein [Anaeroarcus burkinensis]|uniref:gp53-like domain-containing protein n=1 Tax=Anaeroarcus burkinensis TaxID=82376 RepID=UPI0004123BF8|nr:phage tail protein [Anaeroarcus burkinensis]
MTKPDFEKIFASSGTTLPLTDSQFLQGFAYLGENPPTKEEFNWLFQQLCLKMQWLNQNAGFGRWQAGHTYTAGDICFSSVIGDYRFAECTIGGESGTTEPTWGAVGATVTDGGVTWVVRDLRQGTSIGKIPALVDVGGGKAGLPAVSGKLLTDISGIPIGSVVPFLATKAQPGWLALDTGALVSRATYSELWAWVQANAPLISESAWQIQAAAQTSVGAYSTGDGSTTFRLPKILDYVRGGLTTEVGAWQSDLLASHSHTTQLYSYPYNGTTLISGSSTNVNTATQGGTASGVNVNNTGSAGGVETRPKTVKMLYCVKAFDATTSQGLIDITALANEMATKVNSVEYAADHAKSLAVNGYQKLPGGLIMQWGTTAIPASPATSTISFPITFPNNVFSVVLIPTGTQGSQTATTNIPTVTNSNFICDSRIGIAASVRWIALGN